MLFRQVYGKHVLGAEFFYRGVQGVFLRLGSAHKYHALPFMQEFFTQKIAPGCCVGQPVKTSSFVLVFLCSHTHKTVL